jgi:hypothetical protein
MPSSFVTGTGHRDSPTARTSAMVAPTPTVATSAR